MKKYLLLPVLSLCLILILTSCGKSAASVYLRKGKEYYKKNNYQLAIKYFDKTLEVDSNNSDAKYFRALCFYELGHNHHACEEMSDLMKAGYKGADSTLKNMGCFYFPLDSLTKVEK